MSLKINYLYFFDMTKLLWNNGSKKMKKEQRNMKNCCNTYICRRVSTKEYLLTFDAVENGVGVGGFLVIFDEIYSRLLSCTFVDYIVICTCTWVVTTD